MPIKGIGINIHSWRIEGNLEILADDLTHFQALGYDYVEIPVHGVDAVLNGRLNVRQVRKVKEILSRFHLGYTVHCSDALNLMDADDYLLGKDILRASLEFAGEIGAEILVYHSGKITLQDEYLGNVALTRELLTIPDREYVDQRKQAEREALAELAGLAANLGVILTIENSDPRLEDEALWEMVRRMRNHGIDLTYRLAPGGDRAIYNYGGIIDRLIEQIQGIGKPNVGITLDCGHAYISSHYYGFDFIPAIQKAIPYTKHIHIHDDFGKPAGLDQRLGILLPEGRGDLHMPIGWGEIPYRQIFSLLRDSNYSGILLLEISPRYNAFYQDALQDTKALLKECGLEVGGPGH